MSKVIVIALLCALAFSQVTIELKKQQIKFTNFEDEVYYHKALFNTDSKKTKTIFDMSTHQSWKANAQGTGNLHTTQFGSYVNLQNGANVKDTIELSGEKYKDVSFVEGAVQNTAGFPNPNPWAKELPAGFALGMGSGSFLKAVTQHDKLQYQAFSFYIRNDGNQDISQIRFGSPQGFFSTSGPVLFQTQPDASNQGMWKVHLTNFGLDATNTKSFGTTGNDGTDAIFSSTTRYSYIPSAHYNWLKTTLTNYYGILFSNGDQCPCTADKNPQIFFQFSDGNNKGSLPNAKEKFSLEYDDFVVKNSDGNCHLAFKPGNDQVVLGTSFLKGVYVWFYNPPQGQATVRMANTYKVTPQPKKLNDNYRMAFLIAGVLLLALSLLFLVSLLRKVPYVETQKVVRPQQQFVQPQSYVVQQGFIPGQSVVMRSPNVVIANRSVSPQRVVYQGQY